MKKTIKRIFIIILLILLFPIPITCGCFGYTCTSAPDENGYIHRIVKVKPLITVGIETLTGNCIMFSYFSYNSREKYK